VALEQMHAYAPEALASFQALASTGAVEILGETYHHSLAALYDRQEFREQVRAHVELLGSLFEQTPRVFRNTELIYSDDIAREVSALGFQAVLAEGAERMLEGRSPHRVYRAAETDMALLLRDYSRSDDVAFRFSNQGWKDYPLSAAKFAGWLHETAAETVNLFMDYETFGEHQWEETGIFQFLEELPGAIMAHANFRFCTPSELIEQRGPALSAPEPVSWADAERDTSAWTGNAMQTRASERLYALGARVKRLENRSLTALWRKLTTSDHVYYMSTKWFGDADVHAYFSPFESPYDAFISFMNVLSDLEDRVQHLETEATPSRAAVGPGASA
jgi:alpha-amylase